MNKEKVTLNQKDIEIIERLIYKNADDLAIGFARGLERLEERMDAMEERLNNRFSDELAETSKIIRELMESLEPVIEAHEEIVTGTK